MVNLSSDVSECSLISLTINETVIMLNSSVQKRVHSTRSRKW